MNVYYFKRGPRLFYNWKDLSLEGVVWGRFEGPQSDLDSDGVDEMTAVKRNHPSTITDTRNHLHANRQIFNFCLWKRRIDSSTSLYYISLSLGFGFGST